MAAVVEGASWTEAQFRVRSISLATIRGAAKEAALVLLGGLLLGILLDTLAIHLLDLGDTDRNRTLAGLVEDLAKGLNKAQ